MSWWSRPLPRPVLVACPNLSLDYTEEVDEVVVGRVHRTSRSDVRGGGKGVNVARALACIGQAATVVGFTAGRTGDLIANLLADEGIPLAAVPVSGRSRSCFSVVGGTTSTVFNEPGPNIGPDDWDRLLVAVDARLTPETVLVVSGSLPLGAPPDAPGDQVRLAVRRGCDVLVDVSGTALRPAIAGRPKLITPNLAEARAACGQPAPEVLDPGTRALHEAAELAEQLRRQTAGAVLVTGGSAGAALADEDGTTRFPPLPVTVTNAVGAGDCAMAGVAAGVAAGVSLVDAVRFGLAMATASCETFPAGVLDLRRAELLHADAVGVADSSPQSQTSRTGK
jgi:1-phosphofructokinase family hexose kinase